MKHLLLLLFALLGPNIIRGEIEEIVAKAGDEVLLSCPVNTPECGDFHSLKWYRDSSRMYVYSPAAKFSNAEGVLMDRCLDISQRSLGADCARGYLEVTDTNADLKITPIEMTDEGEYRCEITYLDVSNNCPVVHFTNLRTVAAPEYVSMSISSNPDEDISGQVVGPYSSGSSVAFSCESGGGKPAPSISWRFGEEDLEGETTVDENILNGDITVTSVVVVDLEREHSGAYLYCSVINEVLDEPLETQVQVDVNVAVKSVSIEEETTGQEDTEMVISCSAVGGRPLPVISWHMPESVEFETEEESEILEDETFKLISKLTFTPSKEENEKYVTCQAINEVMDEALEDEALLDIMYAPRVSIEDENITMTAGEEIIINCLIDANPMNFSQVLWFHNENIIDVEDERFEGENSEIVSLAINPIVPGDAGNYYCLAENEVGQAVSTNSFDLEVLYPPSSQLRIEPEGPVSEEDHVNVTLYCDVVEGNPLVLSRVSWFLNGDLIRELPDPQCHELMGVESEEMVMEELLVNEGESTSLCDIDPTELILHEVTRDFQGNFTCAGSNIAGEGSSSEPVEVIVYYLPGEAVLIQNEEFPIKGSSTVMTCLVEERGNPEAIEFLWRKGDTFLEERSENLTLNDIGLASQENISCSAVNEIGSGESDTVQLEAFVPPNFIENLPEETSFLSNDDDLSLMCQAECFPLCTITWLKNNEIITDGEDIMIEESVIPEDLGTNTFTSVLSKLSWNLENFPDNKLDHNELNFTISCQVDENDIGLAISSTSHITVEYAPENVEISASFIELEEGEVMEPILCSADASPEATFVWKFNDEVVSDDSVLEFLEPIKKEQAGNYFCHISNEHGEEVSNISVTVLYKPECTVTYTLMEEEVVLLCTANANPNDLTFWWEKQNDTLADETSDETKSEVTLKLLNEILGEYNCHVSNSIGEGEACMLELTEVILTKGLSEDELIIIVAVAAGVLALVLVSSILVCVYCGKKGKGEKGENGEAKTPKTDDQPHSDKSFYENLPFHGLKQPPKEVISARLSADMDYADADYKDLYVEGPLGYRKISENTANQNKSETNENGL
eukprot:TRINITY_DN8668_c0_g1_i1.p1 TRINITY_DN8668_c0_g1~~TRINITY_DN8668_c0_g1_i1.p1  ORF type:complete len:1080 (-),score=259.44 TRINITY_DN8668_c0_g1_i1:89-3328(-)